MAGIGSIARRIFGSSNDRKVKRLQPNVAAINAMEDEIATLSDDALRAKTDEFRAQLADGAKLDDLLVPAFAVVREASKRALGMRPFDVQLIGGIVLHEGRISEMKTGEGKTLVATLPTYLNALSGKGVHVVTVNDYLASRDSAWMGQIFNFLGMTVGVITHGMTDDERRDAYACDVTYGTNNEFGFDYLRDNMKYSLETMVQRKHHYAIVDEVDSILIDEARTPLIISGALDDQSDLYHAVDALIPRLDETSYDLDEKQRTVTLTEDGNEQLEDLLRELDLLQGDGLYDVENVTLVHHANQALRAHKLFTRDADYVVKDNRVVIIDEFTGRMMEGRRYSDGLHQALEAKEGVEIQPENQTLASITFQNYFRLYDKLAGMTGTAATEAEEFESIYGLEVMEIPTNVPVARQDDNDEVYRTAEEKFNAIVEVIDDCQKRGQPILVGTTTIEKSEYLSDLLAKKNVPHNVLNARYHETEAEIVAQAGVPGAVTIATNMAGRGTDIQLGGNLDMRLKAEAPEDASDEQLAALRTKIEAEIQTNRDKVLAEGGLFVLGTERHESRRIDNQLRGRSGRQGDPGHSRFYLSLEDDLMRIFGQDRLDGTLRRFGIKDGEAIVHPWIDKALAKAQGNVEARNFDIRKNLLKFDDVMNDQRKVIFEQRIELMSDEDLSDIVTDMRHEAIDILVGRHIPERAYAEQWDTEGLAEGVTELLALDLPIADWAAEEGIADEEMRERLYKAGDEAMAERAANIGPETMRQIEKAVLLQTLDGAWRDHLIMLDHLRQVVGLRGYAQRDPLNEYKTEAFALFENLLVKLREDITRTLFNLSIRTEPQAPDLEELPADAMKEQHIDPTTGENEMDAAEAATGRRASKSATLRLGPDAPIDPEDPATWGKVARNAACPCGSGKKFKHCHGQVS